MLVTNTEQNLRERTKHMDRKFTFMTQGNFPESHLAEPYQFVLQCISLQEDQKADLLQSDLKPVFISYNGIQLQQEETEGILVFIKQCIANKRHRFIYFFRFK